MEGSNLPSTIERICAFDTKKYKNIDSIFAVSAFEEKNKKIFQISYFCSALPSFLVDDSAKIVNSQ